MKTYENPRARAARPDVLLEGVRRAPRARGQLVNRHRPHAPGCDDPYCPGRPYCTYDPGMSWPDEAARAVNVTRAVYGFCIGTLFGFFTAWIFFT